MKEWEYMCTICFQKENNVISPIGNKIIYIAGNFYTRQEFIDRNELDVNLIIDAVAFIVDTIQFDSISTIWNKDGIQDNIYHSAKCFFNKNDHAYAVTIENKQAVVNYLGKERNPLS